MKPTRNAVMSIAAAPGEVVIAFERGDIRMTPDQARILARTLTETARQADLFAKLTDERHDGDQPGEGET